MYYAVLYWSPASSAAIFCAAPLFAGKGFIPELSKLRSRLWGAGPHCLPEIEKQREFWSYALIIYTFFYPLTAYLESTCKLQLGCYIYDFGLKLLSLWLFFRDSQLHHSPT